MHVPDDEWLERVNLELSAQEVPPHQRHWTASQKWAVESRQPLLFGGLEARYITTWFEKKLGLGPDLLGPMFRSVFYHDATVWPLIVPAFFGTVRIETWSMLKAPPVVLTAIAANSTAMVSLATAAADSLDVGAHGNCQALSIPDSSFAAHLWDGADRALRGAADLLLARRSNPKALELARDAVECYLKAFLAHSTGLDEKGATKIRHDLHRAVAECINAAPGTDFASIGSRLRALPRVEQRYKLSAPTLRAMWDGYALALFTAATVVRVLSGSDARKGLVHN